MNASAKRPARLLVRMFYGSSGLRAGWRVSAFVAVMAVLEWQGGRVIAVEHELFGSGATAAGSLFEKAVAFILVLLVVLIIGALERRTLADYGLPLRRMFGKQFWTGALWGFAILTANIALMVLSGAYSFGQIVLPLGQIVRYGALWLVASSMIALAEEFAFRGYLQFTLSRGLGFWPASVVTSILFGLVHLDASAPGRAIANIALMALFLCLALRRTGSLWFGIGAHMSFDWGLSFFYSCNPDATGHLSNAAIRGNPWLTGGTAGPEGNIFNPLLFVAAILLLSRVYPRIKYPTADLVLARRTHDSGHVTD